MVVEINNYAYLFPFVVDLKAAIMRKCFWFIASLLILIPVDVFCQATYDPKMKLLSIKPEGRLLSEILSEVSAKTGIDIYINPALDKKVFVNIESQPIEKAIKRMIKPLNINNAIIFQGNSIIAVKIFEKSGAEATIKIIPSVTYSETTSPPIGQGSDKKIQTTSDFENMMERKKTTGIAESPGQTEASEERE